MTTLFLYLASIEQLLQLSKEPVELLNEADQARYRKMKSKRNADQLMAGRWLIHHALEQEYGIPFGTSYRIENFRIWHSFESKTAFHLSLSHSQDRVALLICSKPVRLGLDIEYGKERAFNELICQFATTQEQQAFLKAPSAKDEFYRLWTLKEAWFKLSELSMPEVFQTNFQALLGPVQEVNWQGQNYLYHHTKEANYYHTVCYGPKSSESIALEVRSLVESSRTFL